MRKCQVQALVLACAMLVGAPSNATEKPKPQALRYKITVALEPERGFLHAQAAITLRLPEPLDAIELELNPSLKILEVTDAQGRKLSFDRGRLIASPRFLVHLAESASAEVTLTITYEGVPTLSRSGLDYINKNGILLRDDSRWYPAADLSAFTENEIVIGVPSGWMAFTSGQPQWSVGAGLAATYAWKTARPVSSRSILALPTQPQTCVPPPVPIGGGAAKLEPLSACYLGPHQELGKRIAAGAHELLERHSQTLGAYPHSTLTVVEGFPGAQGAIGYTAPGLLVVSPDFVKFFSYAGYEPEFLPHEIAHQWFPSEVTLASEADGWLAESLAEYLALRDLEETDPAQAKLLVERAMRDALAPDPLRPLSLGLRLFALEDWDVTYATLYQRGMLVFRTLETVMGRERLDLALRELYKRKAGSNASIADFRKICAEVAGQNLDWFFDYFLSGTRIPKLALRPLQSTNRSELAGEILVRNVPPEFAAPIELRIRTARGTLTRTVEAHGELTHFAVPAPASSNRVALDPDLRVLRWTEAARRNRRQRALLARLGELERKGDLIRAAQICQQALALDREDRTRNRQQIYFQLGRLRYRRGQYARARQDFERALAPTSLDPITTDFYRAWSHVYRARIALRRHNVAESRAEARAGLKLESPALDTPVRWPEFSGEPTTAREQLLALRS